MSKEIIWQPSKDLIRNSKLTKFLGFCKIKDYDELEKKSSSNPGWLWENVIKFSNLKFFKSYKKIMDDSKGIPWTKWCVGGKTNITYDEFDKKISKVGNTLKINGFKKGDVIALYMPQFIETYIAYFAILKIGCIVLPLFSGYGSKAVIERLNIAKAKGIFTVDKTFRKAKEIRMFDLIKDELQKVKSLEKIFLLGKDKGKNGKVLRIVKLKTDSRIKAVVEGVNIVKKHTKQ